MTIAETPRLRLRYFEPEDVLPLSQILADPEVMRFSVAGPKTLEQTQQLVDGCRAEYEANGYALCAVVHKEDQRLIGYCGFMPQIVNDTPEIELGYRLHPMYWGRGLGTEAAQAVVKYAADTLKLMCLVAVIEAGNIGSVQVALRAGFHKETEMEWRGLSVGVYAITLLSGC